MNRKQEGAELGNQARKEEIDAAGTARPTELRYRMADFINDRLKILPGFHRALKSVFSSVAPGEAAAQSNRTAESEALNGQTSHSRSTPF